MINTFIMTLNWAFFYFYSELDEALIVLPFSVVTDMMTLINHWLQVIKVARTYLFALWLCFWIGFFDRNDLTDFRDFFFFSNFKKMLFIFFQV